MLCAGDRTIAPEENCSLVRVSVRIRVALEPSPRTLYAMG